MRSKTCLFMAISLVCLQPASAQSSSWTTGVTDSKDTLYAATVNDSGNVFGEYCKVKDGSCVWLLGMSSACKEGDQYPVLANSDAGSVPVTVYCSAKIAEIGFRYVFTDFKAIDSIVTEAIRVGFAVPLQGDQFRVLHFDLSGSTRAIKQLQAELQRRVPPKQPGTSDQVL